jgi:EAL domain-containing protein (putative c-di-GMP-specific phosphodiesterase class I)/GGDEF domain-containing protein
MAESSRLENNRQSTSSGLPSRTAFVRDLDAWLAQADTAEREALWVAVVRIPVFYYVDAVLGFEAGDALLREAGAMVRRELPEAVAVSQLDGPEVVVASCGPLVRVSRRGSRPPDTRFVLATFDALGPSVHMSLRVGVCRYAVGDDGAEMLRKAHLALVEAQEDPGASLRVYSPEMGERAIRRASLVPRLARALEEGALTLHYQPQIALDSGALVGVEALLRWPLPNGGFISPGEMIPVAERSELIVPLGEWVLRQACRQAAAWRRAGLPEFRVAVNVSPVQFIKTDLVGQVRSALEESGLPPHALELELTEGALMSDGEEAVVVLAELRRLGVQLAVDDFGTGYSSLGYLKRFPLHRLKIDQAFVRGAVASPEDAAIVSSVIDLARNLHLMVLAEGIEGPEQARLLAARGCDEVQGYYYGRPMSVPQLEEWLLSGPPVPSHPHSLQ